MGHPGPAQKSNTADELYISRKTASVHVANIKEKFGAASRVEIATMALERGLVALGALAPDDT